MSYSCRLRVHLRSFVSRLRLRNSHVSAEQCVTKMKRLPATYYLKRLVVHRTVMHSCSVGPRRESVFETRWLAKARTRSSYPTGCRSTALAPAELASVCTMKMLFQSGNAGIVGEVSFFLANERPPPLRSPKRLGICAFFFAANSFFS